MSQSGQPRKQFLQGQQLCTPCDAASIKQALAIAIVRQKRKCSQEADEWRAKAQALVTSNAAIKAWATSVLRNTSTNAAQDAKSLLAGSMGVGTSTPQTSSTSIFLPPLTTRSGGNNIQQHASAPALQASYTSLQQQLLLTAEATSCAAAASVLSGKAAALSDMLITNIQMLHQLHHPCKLTSNAETAAGDASLSKDLQQAPATDVMSTLGSFVQGTLLQVPNSSLRLAYMQHCAVLLAALLSQPTSDASLQQQPSQPNQPVASPVQAPLQQLLHKKQSSNQMDSVAVQAVGLMRLLLQLKISKSAAQQLMQQQPTQDKFYTPATDGCSSIQQAATAMLQQLSSFPGTALLMALAVIQQLQQHVQRLQQANVTVRSVRLGALGSSRLAATDQALGVATELFEASHQLIEELDQAIQHLPAWTVALASSSWTVKALEDLVAMTASMYSSCPGLQQHQYLLAEKLCRLAASLATALQHLATAADAPGMRSSSGAALRSACGGLCMQLRDVFMPDESPQ